MGGMGGRVKFNPYIIKRRGDGTSFSHAEGRAQQVSR